MLSVEIIAAMMPYKIQNSNILQNSWWLYFSEVLNLKLIISIRVLFGGDPGYFIPYSNINFVFDSNDYPKRFEIQDIECLNVFDNP